MERSEPSFVPEWLKGGNGGCSNSTTYQTDNQSHQELRQRSQLQVSVTSGHTEIDSPRYLPASERVLHSHPRRNLGNSTILNERAILERDASSQARLYSTYNRSSSYRPQDGSEHERSGRGDYECDRDWERERDRVLGFDERDRYHERLDDSLHLKHNSLMPGRYDLDISFKRALSLGSPNKSSENGSPRHAVEPGALLGPLSLSTGNLSSNIHKAAFERNFPSLGSQEKPVLQSSLGDVSALSGRPFWQGSSSKVDVARASSPGLVSSGSRMVSVSATGSLSEGWRGVPTEVPVSSGNNPSSNGPAIVNLSKGMTGTVTTPVVGGTQQSAPKMAEALLQNPPRVRTPPQHLTESQRLEELAWKQSRQLIPMKPSLPKTMAQGLSPREKPKSKIGRALDGPVAVAQKLNQPNKMSSQPLSPLYRTSTAMRSETSKPHPGMLVVQKTSKDALSGVSAGKLDFSSQALNLPNASSGVVSGPSNVLNSGVSLSRKTKQFPDRRVMGGVHTGSASDSGSLPRLKDGIDDKKLSSQAQNRSDFFNALRRKAAGTTGINSGNLEVSDVPKQKIEEVGSVEVESCGGETRGSSLESESDELVVMMQSNDTFCNADRSNNEVDGSSCDEKVKCDFVNGDTLEGTKDIMEQVSVRNNSLTEEAAVVNSSLDDELRNISVAGGSEEEEAAFLKSLGWVENPDDAEEALTEEEISSFLKEHMPAMTSRGLCSQYSLRLEKFGAHTDKAGSTSSGNSSLPSKFDIVSGI